MVEVCSYCGTVYRAVVWIQEGQWGEYGEIFEAWEMVGKGIQPESTQGKIDSFRIVEGSLELDREGGWVDVP